MIDGRRGIARNGFDLESDPVQVNNSDSFAARNAHSRGRGPEFTTHEDCAVRPDVSFGAAGQPKNSGGDGRSLRAPGSTNYPGHQRQPVTYAYQMNQCSPDNDTGSGLERNIVVRDELEELRNLDDIFANESYAVRIGALDNR